MDHCVIFSTEQYGFNQKQVVNHFGKMVTEFDELEKKYQREKQKNKQLRDQVKRLKETKPSESIIG